MTDVKDEGKVMQWDSKIGLSSVLNFVQLLVLLIGGAVFISQMQNSIDNSKLAVTELKNVVTSIQTSQSINAERVGKLETSIGFIANSVQRLETLAVQKIDERKTK